MKAVLEHVAARPEHSFYCGQHAQAHFASPWHYHPQWELTYIVEGEGILYMGNSIRHFAAGELVLVGPNLPHCWKSNQAQADSPERANSVFFQWDENLLGEGWLQKEEFKEIAKLLHNSATGLIFDSLATTLVRERLLLLQQKTALARLMGLVDILAELSVSRYSAISAAGHLATDRLSSNRLDKVFEYVAQNYHSKISASQLATLTHLTEASFSKFIRRTLNKTFTEFLNEYRVSKACGLLKRSECSVEEVAFQCGYQNMAFFHRQFKRITKQTPAAYRRAFTKI